MNKQQSNWWARIREGLVRDPDAPHYKKMGNALWVYLNLHMGADLETGQLFRTYQTICKETGIPEPTVRKMMKKLEGGKYIQTVRLARGLHIQILKWDPVKKKKRASISGQSENGVSVQKSKSECPNQARVSESGQSLNGRNNGSKPSRVSTNGQPNETLNETQNKREKNLSVFSDSKHPKPTKKAAPKSNPDIKVAIDYFHDEFLRIHGFKPTINGTAGKTFQNLLGDGGRSLIEIKELTTAYLSQPNQKLIEAGFPVEWLPRNIDGLLLKRKKPERGFVH